MLKHVWEMGRKEHECGRGVDKLFKIRSLEPWEGGKSKFYCLLLCLQY